MKETKIEIPAGCEVEKIETIENSVVVTFKAKDYKRGDFGVTRKGCVGIIDEKDDDGDYFLYCRLIDDEMYHEGREYSRKIIRLATEDEKQKLLKAIDNQGYEWDAEKLELRKKEPQVPKSWEEFCEFKKYINGKEAFVTCGCNKVATAKQAGLESHTRQSHLHLFLLPDQETAEAVLAFCQLIQLRECYNQGWKPDWKNIKEIKYIIEFEEDKISTDVYRRYPVSPLYFKTEELRDEFLRNFRDLIEKLKPLYGIAL